MNRYDVHLFVKTRVKVPDIEADNQIDAIKKAVDSINLNDTLRQDATATHPETEWADSEPMEYLVDEVGDDEYDRSQWYKDQDGEIVENPIEPEKTEPDGENMAEEEERAVMLLSAIDEADTAFAVINMCDDLTPQARSALRSAWAKVQAILVKLSPDGALAEAIKETPTSAYNLVNPSKEAQDQFPLEDWQYEVMNGDTKRGYNEWLAVQLEDCQHTL